MSTKTKRRAFIKNTSLAAAGASLLGVSSLGYSCNVSGQQSEDKGASSNKPGKPPGYKGRGSPLVTSSQDPKVFGTHGHDEKRVLELVNSTLMRLVDVKKPDEAFRALFKPSDIVSIKLNCLAGPTLSSSVSVVNALVKGLRSIGISHRDIYIWESTGAQLKSAGFELNRYSTTKPRCMGNDEIGFERDIQFSGDIGSLFTNILAKRTTALINVPVLKDHDLSGVACGMKNMYGAIHNPNRYHDNNCDPFVADVCAHPYIKDKLKLTLTDALNAQYQGGPARVTQYQWRESKILAATDPVAMDRIAQDIIEKRRSKHGMASLLEAKRPPKWLETAFKHGLGENRLDKIKMDEA